MKGKFFQKPLELGLEVQGESWRQGDPIQGRLTVKNHGAESPAQDIQVHLAWGTLKKVHKKEDGAFEILSTLGFSSDTRIPAQGDATLDWKFQTEINCPITDSTDSLFLVYGSGEKLENLGQLQLKILPSQIVLDFLDVLNTEHRFVLKSHKFSKGWVESKFSPPSSKSFAMVDLLTIRTRFEGENLEVKYSFQVKKLESTAASMDTKKDKREHYQLVAPHQLRIPSGRVNFPEIEKLLREALDLVESKVVF